jgi:hypothetical protein
VVATEAAPISLAGLTQEAGEVGLTKDLGAAIWRAPTISNSMRQTSERDKRDLKINSDDKQHVIINFDDDNVLRY